MSQPFNSKTKIVATLGPNSNKVPVIQNMLTAGLTVARINMSHGDHNTHAELIKNARLAAKRAKRPIAILQDLSGPKIRIGDFETEQVTLIPGESLILTTKRCVGTATRVFVNYAKLPLEVEVGMYIYLNDGKQKLLVDKIKGSEIHTTVIVGGQIRGRRGVNIPEANLSISSLTPKDKKDLAFGLEQGVDFVTLSFVRSAADIRQLRRLAEKTRKVNIVAKIETKFAIDNLDEIVAEADVIMVARGDLAIETPLENVPMLQKHIIHTANQAGKPVITATQMLDSMRVSTTPTRAEVADIANAILDGTDAVMLSDETAVGEHPAHTIEIMSRIAHETEADQFFIQHQSDWDFSAKTVYDAVSQSIAKTAASVKAKAIVAFSESGYTGRMVARYRPRVPILVCTPNQVTYNQALIIYGCEPVLIERVKSLVAARQSAKRVLRNYHIAEADDLFIIGAGVPFGKPGATNMMMVEKM
ncbi:MAG: pyruvate kinase [Candidatus Nomurabacteria bacterium]|nr:pyruvate kinase [Candidatus Nomurabacteria bacterium]USN87639.1 MAG: pyruvate kinase [Candidatus Nomurabacteria bacterium]